MVLASLSITGYHLIDILLIYTITIILVYYVVRFKN